MRTALLTWAYPPFGSGLGRAAQAIAEGLREAGCDVTIFNADWPAGRRETDGDLRLVGCAPEGAVSWLRRRAGAGHFAAPLAFKRAVRRDDHSFDVIEGTNWYAPAALLVQGRTPVVVRNSTPAIDAMNTRMSARDKADLRVAHWLEARTARKADALISNTLTHTAMIEDLYGLDDRRPHRVIGLALEPSFLAAGAAAPPADPAAGFLFVGRDEARKGFRDMLGAYALIAKQRAAEGAPPVPLTVIGVERALVERLLSDQRCEIGPHITALASATDEELAAQYARAGIVLAPSRYESYGLVYREAAAFGRPLVACAEDPAARAFVAEAQCGVLADTCTPKAIAEAACEVLGDRNLAATLGARGKEHARGLTRRALAEQTIAVYESVLRSG